MGETSIEWATYTFNPWWGCTKVSPGCFHCYAEAWDRLRARDKQQHWGPGVPRLPATEATWREPLKWEKTRNAERMARAAPCRFCDLSLDCAEHGLVVIPASGMLYNGLPYPIVSRAFQGVFPADE